MKIRKTSALLLTATVFASVMSHAEHASAAGLYSLTDLGVLPGDIFSDAYDINNNGYVVGLSRDASRTRSFVWSPNDGMQDLGNFGDYPVYVQAINDLNQAVGQAENPQSRRFEAFIWDNDSGIQTLTGVGGSSIAWSINNSGTVIGSSGNGSFTPFVWTESNGRSLPSLASSSRVSAVTDINNNNYITGGWRGGAGFIWREGESSIVLEHLFGGTVQANSINNNNQAAGYAYDEFSRQTAVMWDQNGSILSLGRLAEAHNSRAHDINDFGYVVGQSANTSEDAAFIWSEANGLQNLNDLIDPALGFHLSLARGINNHGQIVGVGYYFGDVEVRGFLLTPSASTAPDTAAIPTPALLPGLLGMGAAAIRKRRLAQSEEA